MRVRYPSIMVALAAAIAITACAEQDPLVIETEAGLLQGSFADDGSQIRVFKGVPYARPPVASGRWRPPSAVEGWDGVRVADHTGSACWQTTGRTASVYTKGITDPSEDCLYLNVWTPPAGGGPAPVMVWFHGGGNTAGEGGSDIFDGTALAHKGAVLVTVNYRLGVFGFLAHPALTAESEHRSSGNYGLLDQIASLEWVRDNISEFGGDPTRVTIFGQSAGSSDACRLMASPLASGLFHRVIGQSGSCLGGALRLEARQGSEGEASAHANGLRIAEAFGVEGDGPEAAASLRAVESETLQTTRTGVGTGPIIDGWVTPRAPREVFELGEYNRAQLMVGSMADETKGLQPGLANVGADEYEPRVRRQYGASAATVLAAYEPFRSQSVAEALFRMTTDAGAGAGARRWARLVERAGDPVYLYYFSHPAPVFRLYITDDPHLESPNGPRGMGAYHSADLAYVFNNVGRVGMGWDEHDIYLADVISSYWVNFAATGDPNGEGLPTWPTYQAEKDEVMEFGALLGVAPHPRASALDLFDSIGGW
jgi:para-nitrobenzyl esterase